MPIVPFAMCATREQRYVLLPLHRNSLLSDLLPENVDVALKRFMKEWFPKEVKEKDNSNQIEAAHEQAREMGFNPDAKCDIM